MQQLWQIKVNWDDQLTESVRLKEHWQRLQHNYRSSTASRLIDLMISKEKLRRIELHGFSDASEVAYGACIYDQLIFKGTLLQDCFAPYRE